MIEVKQLTKTYTDKVAVNSLDFVAKEGTIHGLLGPNGSGKTTLIRCITRIIAQDSGEILLDGKPIEIKDVYKIGYMPEERGLYKKMKVGEQIVFFAQLKGMKKADAIARAHKLLKELGLPDVWNKKIDDLSKGMAQKIQFINTIINDPKILILDEPFSGFDPVNAAVIRKKVLEYKQQGAVVILSTHDMSSVETICDEFTLIHNNTKILSGNVEETTLRYSAGNYTIEFGASSEQFLAALSQYCEFKNVSIEGAPSTRLTIKLYSAINVRDFIEFANKNCEIIEFKRNRASMNEIFLRAVEGEIL